MAENFGLKIGLEGEKEFKSALTENNNSFKVLDDEMKHVKSQFDENNNSIPISCYCPVYWIHFNSLVIIFPVFYLSLKRNYNFLIYEFK